MATIELSEAERTLIENTRSRRIDPATVLDEGDDAGDSIPSETRVQAIVDESVEKREAARDKKRQEHEAVEGYRLQLTGAVDGVMNATDDYKDVPEHKRTSLQSRAISLLKKEHGDAAVAAMSQADVIKHLRKSATDALEEDRAEAARVHGGGQRKKAESRMDKAKKSGDTGSSGGSRSADQSDEGGTGDGGSYQGDTKMDRFRPGNPNQVWPSDETVEFDILEAKREYLKANPPKEPSEEEVGQEA